MKNDVNEKLKKIISHQRQGKSDKNETFLEMNSYLGSCCSQFSTELVPIFCQTLLSME